MIGCVKNWTPEGKRVHDDYEQFLEEFAEVVEDRYRDSLVLAQLREAEESDFMRRRWPYYFVVRLREWLADNNDGSVAALSLDQALNEAEHRQGTSKWKGVFLVWLGPLARSYLRANAAEVRVFFAGRYAKPLKYLGD